MHDIARIIQHRRAFCDFKSYLVLTSPKQLMFFIILTIHFLSIFYLKEICRFHEFIVDVHTSCSLPHFQISDLQLQNQPNGVGQFSSFHQSEINVFALSNNILDRSSRKRRKNKRCSPPSKKKKNRIFGLQETDSLDCGTSLYLLIVFNLNS